MKDVMMMISLASVLCLVFHEIDACRRGEWNMFGFMSHLSQKTQRRVFLFAHFPLTLIVAYYLWSVFTSQHIVLWIIWDGLMIFHLIIHIVATKWKTNVFRSPYSFSFIIGAGLASLVHEILMYQMR
jgi:hypothetical protein